MSEQFFEEPILNSPYEYPGRHWELDGDGQPTNHIIDARRRSDLITPVPKAKKQRQNQKQGALILGADGRPLNLSDQGYNPTRSIHEIRAVRRNLAQTFRTLISGWSHQKRPGCCSIGGTTSSRAFVPSSVRSRRSKLRSG